MTLISAKLLDDFVRNNRYWSTTGGLALNDLNLMEVQMLELFDYHVLLPPLISPAGGVVMLE